MGGYGSGRKAVGSKGKLTFEEKVERNRARARERWRRLSEETKNGETLNGYQKYKLSYKVKYHSDEERLGYLRESSRKFTLNEDPRDFLIYIREKNRMRLDEILNDAEAMERIFADRDDIPDLMKAKMKQKHYLSQKEIEEIERRLNEEFGLVEDRRPAQSTYKKSEEETTE